VPVADFLREDRVMGYFVPVDLGRARLVGR
jgi:hypothetical protein